MNDLRFAFREWLRNPAFAVASAMVLAAGDCARGGVPPYPPSPLIKEVVWAPTNSIIRQARDGDNWPVTWASDDALYTTWGDGTGFVPKVEKKLSCGFAKITGSPPDFAGENVRSIAEQLGQGRNGLKAWGLLAMDPTLYLWFGHADKQGGASRLAWSRDRARTWTFAEWQFSEFGLLGFVNFGRGNEGARDPFVYAYSHDGPRADTPADRFVLLRAPQDRLTARDSWEFFAGFQAAGQARWTRDVAQRAGVFIHRDACLRSAMTYNAGLRRYLWWQHIPQPPGHADRGDTRFDGGFAIYDAPEPWGPWTTAYFTTQWDVGPGEHGDFPAKWISLDGRSAWLVFSGEDAFSVRQATFVVAGNTEIAAANAAEGRPRGTASAGVRRPATFPHRIWAACDFEGQTPDYGWFGPPQTNNVPRYPGNRTALGAGERPYKNVSAVMTGINPVPGPRMGKQNGLFLRYFLKGGSTATFQHFSLTREDNWHIAVDGLTQNRWDEITLNFTRDARRNDGSAEPFGEGERMDDFKLFAGPPGEASNYEVFIDDVIFFANDPALPPEPEPFPNRIILLAAFDTGPKEKYWPGDFEIAESPPAGAFWRAAKSVPRKSGAGQFIRIAITPPRPVGAHTKLRFRYHLTGASAMTVQVFDATVQDNRHLRLTGLKQGEWATVYLDFSRDSRRNDGTANSPFTVGHLVDDLFFFVEGEGARTASLFVDEVALFDAGMAGP